MKVTLTYEERKTLLESLSEAQRLYLNQFVRKRRKSLFGNALAKDKGSMLTYDESLDSEWELLEVKDAGPHYKEVEEKLFCECGRLLRYQYVVLHRETGLIKYLGSEHFEEHLGFSPQVVKEIVKGIHEVHYELDEMLSKIRDHWQMPFDFQIPIEVPEDICTQLKLGLPLLERQLARLERLIKDWVRQKRYKSF